MAKLAFAHQLRGIAALLIVITHYFGIYYGAQGVVAGLTASPDLHLQAAPWVAWMDFPVLKGPFGVAVFFLISGFVIPFSLQKNRAGAFLAARAWRIYPTYIVCLAIGLLCVHASSRYWSVPHALDAHHVLMNSLLLHNLASMPSLDDINWTLAIEIKFYLLAALCWRGFVRNTPLLFGALALGLIGLNAVVPLLPDEAAWRAWLHALSALVVDLNYVLFMLIGVLFHQHYQGQLSARWLAAGALLMLAAFGVAWGLGVQKGLLPIIGKYYAYALGVFALCYAARGHFRRNAVLDFLADISYPLYAVHALAGYTALKILMDRGLAFGPAVSVTLALVLALSWVLHRTVETAASEVGKRWAAAIMQRRPRGENAGAAVK
jgi:peptidoglycan/LPS O-acetylase OafA/YrhL